MLIRRQADLPSTIGGADPRALNRNPPAAESHLTTLMAMTDRATIGIVAALRTDNLGDFFFHQLGKHTQPNPDRQREQALTGRTNERSERLLNSGR